MVDWLKNSKYAWRIHAILSPENTALKIQESYVKFQNYTISLEPPEDGSLVKFPTWQLVRSRIYSWRERDKKQTEKSGNNDGKTPIALEDKAMISMKLFISRLKSKYFNKFFQTFLKCFTSAYTHKMVWKWGVKKYYMLSTKVLIIHASNQLQWIKLLVNTLYSKNVILLIFKLQNIKGECVIICNIWWPKILDLKII